MGVPPYLSHLIRPYVTAYNQSEPLAGKEYPNLNLARLLTRLLSRRTYAPLGPGGSGAAAGSDVRLASEEARGGAGQALPLNFVENTLGYFELDPAAAIAFPQGVKLLVGMFELLWGTATGEELRAWCVRQGWPLAWAYNPVVSFFRCGPAGDEPSCGMPGNLSGGLDTASARLLDPYVLPRVPAGHNISVPPALTERLERVWRGTDAASATRPQLAAVWAALQGDGEVLEALAVEPPFFRACASEACVGVALRSRACVCPAAGGGGVTQA